MNQEEQRKEETPKKKNTWQKEFTQLFIFGVLIFAFKSSFIGNFTVPTGSMEYTILPGDKIIADMRAYDVRVPFTDISLYCFGDPKIGDIIVFDYPRDRWTNYVKRVVGLPGDVIEVTDGFITRNGVPFKTTPESEDFLEDMVRNGGDYEEESREGVSYMVHREPNPMSFLGRTQTFRVPKGQFFVMGDNRDRSSDSREWGFVPRSHIKGQALFIYFSTDSEPGWFTIPKRIRFERFGQGLH